MALVAHGIHLVADSFPDLSDPAVVGPSGPAVGMTAYVLASDSYFAYDPDLTDWVLIGPVPPPPVGHGQVINDAFDASWTISGGATTPYEDWQGAGPATDVNAVISPEGIEVQQDGVWYVEATLKGDWSDGPIDFLIGVDGSVTAPELVSPGYPAGVAPALVVVQGNVAVSGGELIQLLGRNPAIGDSLVRLASAQLTAHLVQAT